MATGIGRELEKTTPGFSSAATVTSGHRSSPNGSLSAVRVLDHSARLIGTSQVARKYGVTQRTIRIWAEQGDLPGFKVGSDKLWRFELRAIERLVKQGKHRLDGRPRKPVREAADEF